MQDEACVVVVKKTTGPARPLSPQLPRERTSTPSLVALLSPQTYGLDDGLDQLWPAHSAKSGVTKPAKILKSGEECETKNKNQNKDQRMTAITEEEAMSSERRERAWFSAKSGVVSGPGECSSMGLGLSESPSRDCLAALLRRGCV